MHHGGPTLRAGEVHSFVGDLILGERGFHGCVDPIDAVVLGRGPIACRVRLGGERLVNQQRICAREMEVVSLADATSALRDAAMSAVRKALPESFGSIELSSGALKSLREDVADRSDALQDGEWALEQGRDVDIESLRRDLARAQRNAMLVDAALRVDDSFERLRSAVDDLRSWDVHVRLSLDALEPVATESEGDPRRIAKPVRGLEANSDILGRALGQLQWVREASIGKRRTDAMPVLYVETTKSVRDREAAARRIADVLVPVPTLPVMILVVDRAKAFELDVAREHKSPGHGVRAVGPASFECGHPKRVALHRPKTVTVDVGSTPTVAFRPKPQRNDSTWVLDSYFAKGKKSVPLVPSEPAPGLAAAQFSAYDEPDRALREIPRPRTVAVWGAKTIDELRTELSPLGLKPALWVHEHGLDRVLVSGTRDDAELLRLAERTRRTLPHLNADLVSFTTLTRIQVMGPLGPRRRLRSTPFVASSLGSVAGFRVWTDAVCPPDRRARQFAALPWVWAVWETLMWDGKPVLEVLRRSPQPDPFDDAESIGKLLGYDDLLVRFVESDEAITLDARRSSAAKYFARRALRLIYVLDPEAG